MLTTRWDEEHFLLHCPAYANQRNEMFAQVRENTRWDVQKMSEDSKWMLEALLGVRIGSMRERKIITKALTKFIKEAMKLRTLAQG